tara:strand:- start:1295 stop:1753 length:459 start_codon:yes stop_codon:yes gene_type:complete
MERSERLRQDIQCVEFYLIDKFNVPVDFDEEGLNEYWFNPADVEDTGVISINSSMDLLEQLYVVLHEAGHVILRQSPNFTSAFPDSSRTTLAGRIEILREEVVAWNKAEELINKFGISHSEYFDREKWKQNYRSALSQYALWVESGDKNEES